MQEVNEPRRRRLEPGRVALNGRNASGVASANRTATNQHTGRLVIPGSPCRDPGSGVDTLWPRVCPDRRRALHGSCIANWMTSSQDGGGSHDHDKPRGRRACWACVILFHGTGIALPHDISMGLDAQAHVAAWWMLAGLLSPGPETSKRGYVQLGLWGESNIALPSTFDTWRGVWSCRATHEPDRLWDLQHIHPSLLKLLDSERCDLVSCICTQTNRG